MCRSALETALYEEFARNRLTYCRPSLEQLINWAKDASLLDEDQVKIAHRIRQEGNFGAHIKQKIDQELRKQIVKYKYPEKEYRIWADPESSLVILKETIKLVIALVR